jgi:hypothetical protein
MSRIGEILSRIEQGAELDKLVNLQPNLDRLIDTYLDFVPYFIKWENTPTD